MKVVKNALYILVFVSFVACNSNVDKSNSENSTQFKLSDPSACDQAILLYNNMVKLANQKILVGHQDALAYGIGWKDDDFRSDINDVCGDYPAIFGWDLGHIGDSTNIDDVSFEKMKLWALKAYAKGGINTYGWHARNFLNDSSSWNVAPCVHAILPNGEKHEAYLVKLNLVADFFADLKNENGELIPVLFRPFHEMNGGWFWWGKNSCTTDEYKALWKFTVDYLRNVRQLHNIIYVYSTDAFASAEEYMAYYPGDEYVDLLGYDDYKGLNEKENTPKAIEMIETIADLGNKKGKLYTISETGIETLPNPIWFTNVVLETLKTNSKTLGVSYVLFWRNGRSDHFYAPYPEHSSAADFVSFKEDEVTLFLSEIQNIYTQEF